MCSPAALHPARCPHPRCGVLAGFLPRAGWVLPVVQGIAAGAVETLVGGNSRLWRSGRRLPVRGEPCGKRCECRVGAARRGERCAAVLLRLLRAFSSCIRVFWGDPCAGTGAYLCVQLLTFTEGEGVSSAGLRLRQPTPFVTYRDF